MGRHLLKSEGWAAVAGLVFALHPVNAEAVNYVTARSSLVSALFATLTFWLFLRAFDQKRGRRIWWWGSLASFAAAVLSKESGIAVLLPLVSYAAMFPRSEQNSAIDRPKTSPVWAVIPFAVVALTYAIVLKLVGGGRITLHDGAANPLWVFVEVLVRSLALWIWPFPLGLDHPLSLLTGFDWIAATATVTGGVLLLAAIWGFRRRSHIISWAFIWAVAGLLPLLPLPWMTTRGLLQENRLAFSAVGLAWLTAAALQAGWGLLARQVPDSRAAQWIYTAGIAILLIIAMGMDRWRATVWHDDRALWEETVRNAPEYPVAHVNLGSAYLKEGEYDRAETAFRRALSLDPKHKTAHYNVGLLALRQGRYQEGRASLQQALALDPAYAKAYRALGTLEIESGNLQAGVEAFQRAAAINPGDAATYAEFGRLAQRAGHGALAERAFQEALRHAPDHVAVRNALGTLYLDQRRWEEALAQFTVASQRDPTSLEAVYNRAVALYRLGRFSEARGAITPVLTRIPPGEEFDSYRRVAQAILRAGETTSP
ncbi:MAG: tetratricopeptide repeat protein [Nitrospirota bacterium]